MNTTEIQEATLENIEALTELMAEYYKEDNYKFVKDITSNNLKEFIANPELGIIFILVCEKVICSYVVVTYGYSFEYGGRDAFIDELFVSVNFRKQQFGKQLLNQAISHCQTKGIKALHLEVESYKTFTQQMYEKAGFVIHNRSLMTLNLKRE